ncbi:MAG: type II toxin-antitoxin system death-on-curing family toxin [Candidatus Aenigmarchaeota archaeon]|nr:type II toxin-antitoxin system death-on-curing family toxin [Candidatus Aenigmarchaeota archaeon]
MGIKYPTADEITEANRRVLAEIKEKKGDRHGLVDVGRKRIETVLDDAILGRGDIYDKAAIILRGLIKKHPFVSGNRRTAFTVTEAFLELNGEHPLVIHDSEVLQGIREEFYSLDEIKHWLKGGKIREFKR